MKPQRKQKPGLFPGEEIGKFFLLAQALPALSIFDTLAFFSPKFIGVLSSHWISTCLNLEKEVKKVGENRIIVLFDNHEKQEKVRPHSSLVHHYVKSSKHGARDTKWNKPLPPKNTHTKKPVHKEYAT